MKNTVIIASLMLFVAQPIFAQSIEIAPRVGYINEYETYFIGGQIDIKPFPIIGLHIVPYADYVDEYNLESEWIYGANIHFDMVPLVLATFYTGAGVGVVKSSFITALPGKLDEFLEEDTTETVYNALVGVRLNLAGMLKPFANVRYMFADNNSLVLEAGIHFTIF